METSCCSIARPYPFVLVLDFMHPAFMNLCKVMFWVVEKNTINAQPLFLLADCSMNMFHTTMLSVVREIGIERGIQIKE